MKKGKLIILAVFSAILLIAWFNCNPFAEKSSDYSAVNVLDGSDITRASVTYYVTPSGSSSAGGTSFSDAMNYSTAFSKAVAGDTVLLQSGTYKIAYTSGSKNTITFSKSGSSGSTIRVEGSGGQAVFDFQAPTGTYVQDSYGFYVTGSYWYFKNITITRASYQGGYVTGGYNTFDTCKFLSNRCSGLEINKGGNHTTVTNCEASENFDPKKDGGMADGFSPKQTQGAGNTFSGCTSTHNSDDGYDCFDSPQVVTFTNCKASRSGYNSGNGQGFKLGGNNVTAKNTCTNCDSSNNLDHGYDANSNPGPITLTNCTGSGNGGSLYSGSGLVIK